jgi:hypothetical protein
MVIIWLIIILHGKLLGNYRFFRLHCFRPVSLPLSQPHGHLLTYCPESISLANISLATGGKPTENHSSKSPHFSLGNLFHFFSKVSMLGSCCSQAQEDSQRNIIALQRCSELGAHYLPLIRRYSRMETNLNPAFPSRGQMMSWPIGCSENQNAVLRS